MAKAKRKVARFKRIVISSLQQLQDILDRYDDVRWNNTCDEFRKAVAFVVNPTPEQLLTAWVEDEGIDLCDTGKAKILKAAGKIHSWRGYFKKHWNDKDGVIDWLDNHDYKLTGRNYLSYWGSDDDKYTFEQFIKHNPGIKWAAWPFPKRKKARR